MAPPTLNSAICLPATVKALLLPTGTFSSSATSTNSDIDNTTTFVVRCVRELKPRARFQAHGRDLGKASGQYPGLSVGSRHGRVTAALPSASRARCKQQPCHRARNRISSLHTHLSFIRYRSPCFVSFLTLSAPSPPNDGHLMPRCEAAIQEASVVSTVREESRMRVQKRRYLSCA